MCGCNRKRQQVPDEQVVTKEEVKVSIPKLLFFNKLHDEPKVRIHFEELCTKYGSENVIGVVSENDILVAISKEHNKYAQENARKHVGEEMWEKCKLKGLVIEQANPVVRKKTLVTKATELVKDAKTLWRAVSGPQASDEAYKQRLNTCARNVCGLLTKKNGKLYCGGCNCPQSDFWKIAELNTKLKYAHLSCPKDLWGEEQ